MMNRWKNGDKEWGMGDGDGGYIFFLFFQSTLRSGFEYMGMGYRYGYRYRCRYGYGYNYG